METFSESNISIFKLFHLNCCRKFPQVATVADIDTADGLRLRPEIFKCEKLKDRKSTLLWPNQPESTDHQKADWKSALTKCLLKAKTSVALCLHQCLGKWTGPPAQMWKLFYSVSTKQLWQQTKTTWQLHRPMTHNRWLTCYLFPNNISKSSRYILNIH